MNHIQLYLQMVYPTPTAAANMAAMLVAQERVDCVGNWARELQGARARYDFDRATALMLRAPHVRASDLGLQNIAEWIVNQRIARQLEQLIGVASTAF